MKKINGIAISEKGALKNAVRSGIVDKVVNEVDLSNLGFEYDSNKKAYYQTYEDRQGNKVYATLTLTIGLKAPSEKAERKSGHKKPVEQEVITID